jgi:hypothetical protein
LPKGDSVDLSALHVPPSSPWFWGLLLAVCLTDVHTIYWTDMRMRAPLVPVVALAVAAALQRLIVEKSSCRTVAGG